MSESRHSGAPGGLRGGARAVALGAALLSAGCAAIHLSTADEHGPLFGAGFLSMALFQTAWAFALAGAPARRTLVAGAAGQLAIVAVWALAHGTGLPFGPGAGEPEPTGLKDLTATGFELLAAAAALSLTVPRLAARLERWSPPRASQLGGAATALALAAVATATPHGATPHHHGSGGEAHAAEGGHGHAGDGAHAGGRAHAGGHTHGGAEPHARAHRHGASRTRGHARHAAASPLGGHAHGGGHAGAGHGGAPAGHDHGGDGTRGRRERHRHGDRHDRHRDRDRHRGGEHDERHDGGAPGDHGHPAEEPHPPPQDGSRGWSVAWEPGDERRSSAVVVRQPSPGGGAGGHHGASPCNPTPEQRAAADALARSTDAALRRYDNAPGRALADGFTYVIGPSDRILHMVNVRRVGEPEILDPARIESFLYALTDRGLIAIGGMYIMPRADTPGPEIGGCLTRWHHHGGVVGRAVTLGTRARTAEMLHVWTYPGLDPWGHYGGRELTRLWRPARDVPSLCFEGGDSGDACVP